MNQQAAQELAAPNPFSDPNTTAVYDQLRQSTSPKEFGDEMLAGASQADPQAVAEFLQELQGLDMPPEVLDALNDVVDEILASPERYDELRAQYMEQGLPEEILPEQFDPQFFAALNMAIDQMIAAPSGVQSFAQGGIAELKPIAKAIASYGRNGDTMLAHITPAEARMLRRRGGSGTTNPDTGLPEFFIKNLFKSVGNVLKSVGNTVKKFASSTVGKLVTTVALGFFLGPAAASLLGVGAGTAASAAISGFVGGAGSTLLAGGSLKDALKTGAIAGLSTGAFAGVTGAPLTGPSTVTPGEAFSGQVAKFNNATGIAGSNVSLAEPTPPLQADVPVNGAPPAAVAAKAAPAPGPFDYDPLEVAYKTQPASAVVPPEPKPGMFDQVKDFYNKNISPSGIQEAGQKGAMSKTLAQFPNATAAQVMNAPATSVLGKAYQAAMPGVFSTYAPIAGVGLGALAAFGGFDKKPVQSGPITQSLMKPVTQRIAEDGTQRQMYMQGLPGVVYDDKGAPVLGQSTPLPTYAAPDYNSGGYGQPQRQPGMFMPPVYIPPPGTIGSRSVAQPYNTSDMYPNLAPRQFVEGGIAALAQGGYPRRTGQIDGPGTEKSDSIPAMLSDGEFVMTAKAVRGAGKGSRRAGAKKMYALMHQLEKNSERG
jgi:hypothetical protein